MHSIMTIAIALYAASLVVDVVFACCTQIGTPAVRAAFHPVSPTHSVIWVTFIARQMAQSRTRLFNDLIAIRSR